MIVSGKRYSLDHLERTLTKDGKVSKGKDKSCWMGVVMNMIGLQFQEKLSVFMN